MELKGVKELFKEVIDTELCSLCGACTGSCPYLIWYKGRVVLMDNCTLSEGQCYRYCPRTHTDFDAVSDRTFGAPFKKDDLGMVREVFLARSKDAEIRDKGQDGGVVTTLLSVALGEGIIDAAVETKISGDKVPTGFIARSREELLQCAGNSYEVSPVLEALNSIPSDSNEKLGVVGLPCHVEALAKMKTYPPQNRVNINNVKLVVGLFCGWVLADGFHQFLEDNFDLKRVGKFDIPHHPDHTFDLYTESGKKSVELDDIRKFINPGCMYCWDMTSEFADISVGSGRAMFKGWNTVIVRTETGSELMNIAKEHALEIQPIPDESLTHLKKAALNKKRKYWKGYYKKLPVNNGA
jgi:coenzyme F420 hydrogenase subunit beta